MRILIDSIITYNNIIYIILGPILFIIYINDISTDLAPVVQKVASAIQWINHYPLDKSIGFASVFPVDSAIHLLNNPGLTSTVKIYADDTKIYRTISSPDVDIPALQCDLARLGTWTNKWQMHFN